MQAYTLLITYLHALQGQSYDFWNSDLHYYSNAIVSLSVDLEKGTCGRHI
jgi:hypothetical protein